MSNGLDYLDPGDPEQLLASRLPEFIPVSLKHLDLDIPGQLPAPCLQGPRNKISQETLGWRPQTVLNVFFMPDKPAEPNVNNAPGLRYSRFAHHPSSRLQEALVPLERSYHRYLQHLAEWAHEHAKIAKITAFRGRITPHPLNYEYKLDRPVTCYLRPLDTEEVTTICIKLSRCRNHDGEADRTSYSMTIKAGSEWEREEEWFGRQDAAQRQRQQAGCVAQENKPALQRLELADIDDHDWITILPPFPFMRLPAELRDHVLTFALDLLPEYTIDRKQNDQDAVYALRPSLKLLLVNRQLHSETARLVFSKTAYRVDSLRSLHCFLRGIGKVNRRRLRKLSVEVVVPNSLTMQSPYFYIHVVKDRIVSYTRAQMGMVQLLRDLSLVEFTIPLESKCPLFDSRKAIIYLRSDIDEASKCVWTTTPTCHDGQRMIAYGSMKLLRVEETTVQGPARSLMARAYWPRP